MQQRKALGKGLASLIPSEPEQKIVSPQRDSIPYEIVDISSIVPNRFQPRGDFSEESLKELAESIRTNGIIQPLLVTKAVSGRFELIAGERRWRAAKIAGLKEVPVIVKEADRELMLELAIVENIQREDLNPIEEARAYKELIESFDYTQEEVSDKVSKSRPHIANTIRLLFLPKVIQEDVVLGRMSQGHARALLAVSDLQEQLKIREKILHSKSNVRDVERFIQEMLGKKPEGARKKKRADISPQLMAVQNEMTQELGTKVAIIPNKKNKGGQIVIDYFSVQDLNRVYKKIIS